MLFGLLAAAVLLLHWYLWRRLVRDTTRPGPVRRVATVVLALLGALLVAALALGTRVAPAVARWFAWPGYLWLALFFYLLLALLVLEVPRLLWRRRTAEPEFTGEA